jgi:hypothetical protein
VAGPTDIVLLTYNRLDHLVRTVDALEARTRRPYRLTVVDNASDPPVRNWLVANRDRFANVIFRAENEHVPAFQYGIDATASDPYIVTDPDLVVPEMTPSWLDFMLDLMERHPDFGLIGVGLDQVNRPGVLPPEQIDRARLVDGEIVEAPVGTWFQTIRRSAFDGPYRSDSQTCAAVERAGFRVGWTPNVRALHLGWDDFALNPEHLVAKHERGEFYPPYAEVGLLGRPPKLEELARAAAVVAETRALGVADDAVVEVTWQDPFVAAAVPAATAIAGPDGSSLPIDDGGAAAVVLVDPPADSARNLLDDAFRAAARCVVVVAPLATFEAAPAASLAADGWSGREAYPVGEPVRALARLGDARPDDALHLFGTLGERERWLELFGAGRFGAATERLYVFERPGETRAVRLDPSAALVEPLPRDVAVRMPRAWRLKRRLVGIAGRLFRS